MKINRAMESGSILVTHISGKSTVIEVLAAINSVQQYITNGELYEIAIFDANVCLKDLLPKTRKIAYKFQQTLKDAHKVTIAIVAATDLILGLFRMVQLQPEDDKIRFKIFRSENAARAWIQECRSQADLKTEKTAQSVKKLPYLPNSFANVPDILRME